MPLALRTPTQQSVAAWNGESPYPFESHLMEPPSAPAPIRVPKTAEVLAARIRRAIIRGELASGTKLPTEAALIAEFGVSRPTVREGLRILEVEGLISIMRGARGGVIVNGVGEDVLTRAAGVALQANGATIAHVYEVRRLIEPPAARRAAELNARAASDALQASLDRERTVVSSGGSPMTLVAEFHRTLLEVSGNVALAMVGRSLHDIVAKHMEVAGRFQAGGDEKIVKRTMIGLRSQEKLIELIAAGDGEGAEQHWIKHMDGAGRVWLSAGAERTVIDLLG